MCIVDTNAWSKYNIVHFIGQRRVHPGIRCGSQKQLYSFKMQVLFIYV